MAKVLLALVVLFMAIFFVINSFEPTNKYVALSTLDLESKKVPPPSSVTFMDDLRNHKSSTAIVSNRYATNLQRSQVSQYYYDKLKEVGWHQIPNNNSSIDSYCNGALRAEVEFNSEMNFYTFSIVWRQRPITECGVNGQAD